MGDEWRRRAAEDCPLVLFPSRGAPFTAEFFLGTTRSFQKQWLWADRTEESGFDKRRLPAPAASFLTSEGSAMLGGAGGCSSPEGGRCSLPLSWFCLGQGPSSAHCLSAEVAIIIPFPIHHNCFEHHVKYVKYTENM